MEAQWKPSRLVHQALHIILQVSSETMHHRGQHVPALAGMLSASRKILRRILMYSVYDWTKLVMIIPPIFHLYLMETLCFVIHTMFLIRGQIGVSMCEPKRRTTILDPICSCETKGRDPYPPIRLKMNQAFSD